MEFQFKKCDNKKQWDEFVSKSTQGNLFCKTSFLDAFAKIYDLLFVKSGDVIFAGVVILKEANGELIKDPFMYQGVLYSYNLEMLAPHSKVSKILNLTEFILSKITTLYKDINISLHHSIIDLRAFQWHNFHIPNTKSIDLNLKYTALINLQSLSTKESFLKNIRRSRRREYQKAVKNGLVIKESNKIDILDELHGKMFLKQGIKRSKREVLRLRNITKTAIDNDFGRLFVCYTSDNIPCSAYLMTYDDATGYSVFGATDPKLSSEGAYTYLTIHCIFKCKDMGLNSWDFLGVNSPNRGDYKTSFNADLVPFYVLNF